MNNPVLVHQELKPNRVRWIPFNYYRGNMFRPDHHQGVTTIVLNACSFVVIPNDGHLCQDMSD